MGKAARRLSHDARDSVPGIAWRKVTGMGNRLVLDVVHDDLPGLIAAIEPLVPDEPAE